MFSLFKDRHNAVVKRIADELLVSRPAINFNMVVKLSLQPRYTKAIKVLEERIRVYPSVRTLSSLTLWQASAAVHSCPHYGVSNPHPHQPPPIHTPIHTPINTPIHTTDKLIINPAD